jgi:hypothetical protein
MKPLDRGRISAHDGIQWCTFEEVVEEYRRRTPFNAGAAMTVADVGKVTV